MRILGAKEILNIKEPKLVHEFWWSTQRCRKLLSNPTIEEVISILKEAIQDYIDDSSEDLDIGVWVGTNGCQVWPLEEEYDGILHLTDINVIGDADPTETLWFVFDDSEWEHLDRYLGIDISKRLKSIWKACVDFCANLDEHENDDVKQFLGGYRYKDIIEANVELKFPEEKNE